MCDCPVLACKRYRILGYMFLKPEDLKKVRVSSLLSLVANTGLGLLIIVRHLYVEHSQTLLKVH